MISAFDVYLVMQLDSISNASGFFGIVGGIICGVAALWSFSEDERFPLPRWFVATIVSCILVFVFMPTTKTMAAMIVLPALTSDEVVQPAKKEAAELYDLAKQALRQAVEDKPKKAAEQ